MATKITIIYENPTDPAAFEAAYAEGHIDLARRLPGVRRIEESMVWPKEDGSPTQAYWLLDLSFDDYAAACAVVATPAAQAFFPAVFSLATGGARIFFCDTHEV